MKDEFAENCVRKKEFLRLMKERIDEAGARKTVPPVLCKFDIIDESGNKWKYAIKKPVRSVVYTMEDVELMYDAFIRTILDSLDGGREIRINGFGSFVLVHRKPREFNIHGEGKINDSILIKFRRGTEMKNTERKLTEKFYGNGDLYELNPQPVYDEDEE